MSNTTPVVAPATHSKGIAAYAAPLATALDDRKSTFRIGSIVTSGVADGYTLTELAAAVGEHAARRMFPAASDADIARLAATPRAKGGFALSKATLSNHSTAWSTLTRSGIDPSEGVYAIAFRLVSSAGLGEARGKLIDRIAAVESEADKVTEFVSGAQSIIGGVNATRREASTPKVAAPEAPVAPVAPVNTIVTPNGSKVELPAPEGNGPTPVTMAGGVASNAVPTAHMSAEVALESIRRIALQEWSPADRERILDGLVLAAEILDPASVTAE